MVRVSKGGENHEFSQRLSRAEVAAGELFGLFLPGFPAAPQLGDYPPARVVPTAQTGRALPRASIDGKKCSLDTADFWLLRVKNDSLNIV